MWNERLIFAGAKSCIPLCRHKSSPNHRMNSSPLAARDRLIVALDFPSQAKALALVSALSDGVSTYKIGLQLYTAAGPAIVQAVAATGAKVFLDLKLHDIPNTVAKAVVAAGDL